MSFRKSDKRADEFSLLRSGMRTECVLPARDLLTTSYNFLNRLQKGEDQESWKSFFERYGRLIYSLAIRAGLTAAEAEDVVQETAICVTRDLHKFQRDRELGTFKGWLRNLTRWRIADQLRMRGIAGRSAEEYRAEDSDSDLNKIPDPTANVVETAWEEEWRALMLETAVERIKHRVREEHFQIFDLYVIKQLPVMEVAKRLGVSAAQIYVTKHRMVALIRKELQILENQLL